MRERERERSEARSDDDSDRRTTTATVQVRIRFGLCLFNFRFELCFGSVSGQVCSSDFGLGQYSFRVALVKFDSSPVDFLR
ncbi:hypothetical protein Hanom_Chr01g00026261 [Helianthus anomalus]